MQTLLDNELGNCLASWRSRLWTSMGRTKQCKPCFRRCVYCGTMPNKCPHKFDLENDPAHRTFLFGLVSSVKLHWQDLWFRHRQCAISCTLPGKYEKPASDSPRIWSILAGPMARLWWAFILSRFYNRISSEMSWFRQIVCMGLVYLGLELFHVKPILSYCSCSP